MNFLRKNVIWVIIVSLILISISFSIGLFVKNWSFIEINHEVQITEVINISFTILLAVLIPIYIKYFIDKGNKVNEMVLGEISRYREHLELIHGRFYSIYQTHRISEDNKAEINVLCEMFDSKFEILKIILVKRCNEGSSDLINELKNNHIEYWRTLTNVEINSTSVTSIHPTTFTKAVKCHLDITDTVVKINLFITNY